MPKEFFDAFFRDEAIGTAGTGERSVGESSECLNEGLAKLFALGKDFGAAALDCGIALCQLNEARLGRGGLRQGFIGREGEQMKNGRGVAIGSELEGTVAGDATGNMRDFFADRGATDGTAFEAGFHVFFRADIDAFVKEIIDGLRAAFKVAEGVNQDQLFFVAKTLAFVDLLFERGEDRAVFEKVADARIGLEVGLGPLGRWGRGRRTGGRLRRDGRAFGLRRAFPGGRDLCFEGTGRNERFELLDGGVESAVR